MAGREERRDFGFMVPPAGEARHDPVAVSRLDALAQAMTDDFDAGVSGPGLAAIYPFFAGFVCHDILRPEGPAFGIADGSDFVPLPSDRTESLSGNGRREALILEALYGGPGADTDVSTLRDAQRPGFLRVGGTLSTGPVSARSNCDLPRVHALIDRDEVGAALFRDADRAVDARHALIADRRNDRHLGLAQLHTVFLKAHNRVAEQCAHPHILEGAEAVEDWARHRLVGCYHWLIRHDLLPALCDRATLARVIDGDLAPFRAFRLRSGPRAVPLELVSALDFIICATTPATFDWNRYFGASGRAGTPRSAYLDDLYGLTGEAHNPMNALSEDALPAIWVADWARLSRKDASGLRSITANVSPALPRAMQRVRADRALRIRDPVRRALRLGHLLSLPDAQTCCAAFEDLGFPVARLSQAQLSEGHTGRALAATGFVERTPLGFYLLKEAETMAGGRNLGPLGTAIVASALLGLLDEADSGGRWTDPDPPVLAGQRIGSLARFLTRMGGGP